MGTGVTLSTKSPENSLVSITDTWQLNTCIFSYKLLDQYLLVNKFYGQALGQLVLVN